MTFDFIQPDRLDAEAYWRIVQQSENLRPCDSLNAGLEDRTRADTSTSN